MIYDMPTGAVETLSDESLRQEVCGLAASLDVATSRLLGLVAELDAREAWGGSGVRSCAHWLSWKCGIGVVAARAQVRVARALRDLPRIRAEFAEGRLSYAKVRALTRIADSDNEEDLVQLAEASTAAQLERTVRAWRRSEDPPPEETARREFRHHWDDAGMLVFSGRLNADEGALLLTALKAVRLAGKTPDQDIEDRSDPEAAGASEPIDSRAGVREPAETIPRNRTPTRTEAGSGETDFAESLRLPPPEPEVDALLGLARAFLNPNGDVHRNPEVVVSVSIDSAVLANDARGGRAAFDVGGALSNAAARRLTCDCALVSILMEGRRPSQRDVLDIGRVSRKVSRAMRRALGSRDGGCTFPGCTETRPERLEAHHVWHWADGGPTALANLTLLCRFHHHCLHEAGYTVRLQAGGGLVFSDPDGRILVGSPRPSRGQYRFPEIDPAGIPAWAGEPLELDFVIGVLRDRRALRLGTRAGLIASCPDPGTSGSGSGSGPGSDPGEASEPAAA